MGIHVTCVCVFVHVCMCVLVHMCAHICECMHVCLCIYVRTCVHACMCVYVHACVCACVPGDYCTFCSSATALISKQFPYSGVNAKENGGKKITISDTTGP